MTGRLVAGCGAAAVVGLACFVAVGLGDDGDGGKRIPVRLATTHPVAAPPPQAAAPAKGASLFKVFYKETNTLQIAAGVTPFRLGSCPRGGAVLSAWHLRIGEEKSGLLATGSSPAGVREMDYVVTNTTGEAVNGRLGLACIR